MVNIVGRQVTDSQSNLWPSNKGSGLDVGSEFSTTKDSLEIDRAAHLDTRWKLSNTMINEYVGPIFTEYPQAVLNDLRTKVNLSSALTLDGMGATAISKVLPTNPAVDAVTFAAELASDGIPKAIGQSLLKDRKKPLRGLASENLNYQFGIAPVVSDVMSLVDTVSKSDKILKQYERDSGRNIRRTYRFPTFHENTTASSILGVRPWAAGSTTYLINSGQKTVIQTVKRDVWFSGCFTYYLNLGSSQADRLEYAAQQAKRLYGVRLTPDVLWNLAPWSWAADWVTNTGDVLKNLSAFSMDGLVMRYGYIMEHYTIMRSQRITGLYAPYGGLSSSSVGETYRFERKIRRRATPFGFGLDPGSFTTRQWSILASLGITRAMR
jgi:hypothetical protein